MNSSPQASSEMQNKILLKRQALEASRETLNYKIKHLNMFYSREQVRCWRIQRDKIVAELRALPTEAQLQQGAKRINYSNSLKFNHK